MTRDSLVGRLCGALLAAPMLVAGLVTQDAPVGPPGTQVATQETSAAATNSDALRKAAQNPIASLISVPVQNNNNFGIGPDGRIQDILNIQPVIPVRVSENWNLITRIITPIIYEPTVSQPVNQGAFGFGDLNPSFFLSPAKPHKIIWGVGPTVVFPTATNRVFVNFMKVHQPNMRHPDFVGKSLSKSKYADSVVEKFQYIRDMLQKEGIKITLPTGN